jgi:uncharacterized protein (TIGR00255 family)
MIQSMTGYAFSTRDVEGGTLTLELKSVNSRFLDLSFRIADELRLLEPHFRELIGTFIARGKVDCRVAYSLLPAATVPASVNQDALQRLGELCAAVRGAMPDLAPMRVSEALNWPGVLADKGDLFERMRGAALDLLREALAEFVAARAREGAKLSIMLRERTGAIRSRLKTLEPIIPQAIAAYQEKLAARLREVLTAGEEERIRQEIAVYGIKIDVAEEFSRLAAHLDEVDRIIGAADGTRNGAPRARTDPIGKRLDFLMQELNREANTLGSKSVSREVSEAVIDFKVMIEQMREQVQNLE